MKSAAFMDRILLKLLKNWTLICLVGILLTLCSQIFGAADFSHQMTSAVLSGKNSATILKEFGVHLRFLTGKVKCGGHCLKFLFRNLPEE